MPAAVRLQSVATRHEFQTTPQSHKALTTTTSLASFCKAIRRIQICLVDPSCRGLQSYSGDWAPNSAEIGWLRRRLSSKESEASIEHSSAQKGIGVGMRAAQRPRATQGRPSPLALAGRCSGWHQHNLCAYPPTLVRCIILHSGG